MTDLSRRSLATLLPATAFPAVAMIGAAQAQTPAPVLSRESTFERVNRTKTMRVAGLIGSPPYFTKDLVSGEWVGACVFMAEDLAKVFGAKVEYVESTYGNSVLDLQSNKIDIGFALNPTPARALSIGFTQPMITHPFGCIAKKGFLPSTWSEVDKPDIKLACDLGSLHETVARRFCPNAQITALKTPDEAMLFYQSGKADALILAALLGIAALGKKPDIGTYRLPTPLIALPSNIGVQREPDTRFVEVVNAWLAMTRGIGQIREWMVQGIEKTGGRRSDIPPELSF